MRAWICILDASGCYECSARAERKSALQCCRIGQNCRAVCTNLRRVALMPQALATARDTLSNDQHESAARFERRGLFFVIPVSSPVAMS